MILLVISATCASLSSHDLFARCAVTPVRNFLCKNWSIIVSIDKQIKVWLAYRFFEGHLPWNPPLNNPLRWVRSCSIRTPKCFSKYCLKRLRLKTKLHSCFSSCVGIFWHKVCWTGRGRRERERGGRSQTRRSQGAGREEWVGQWSIIIWQWTLITRQQPITAQLSPWPANQRAGAGDGAG